MSYLEVFGVGAGDLKPEAGEESESENVTLLISELNARTHAVKLFGRKRQVDTGQASHTEDYHEIGNPICMRRRS